MGSDSRRRFVRSESSTPVIWTSHIDLATGDERLDGRRARVVAVLGPSVMDRNRVSELRRSWESLGNLLSATSSQRTDSVDGAPLLSSQNAIRQYAVDALGQIPKPGLLGR